MRIRCASRRQPKQRTKRHAPIKKAALTGGFFFERGLREDKETVRVSDRGASPHIMRVFTTLAITKQGLSMTFQQLLNELAEATRNNRDKGTQFEKLIASYLLTDPQYADRLSDVWMWEEWPDRWDTDCLLYTSPSPRDS